MIDFEKLFTVGDRVAVYGRSWDSRELRTPRLIGTVTEVKSKDRISVDVQECSTIFICHPKQLRRLKPPRKLREFWISPDGVAETMEPPKPWYRHIHVREVKKK